MRLMYFRGETNPPSPITPSDREVAKEYGNFEGDFYILWLIG